VNLPELIGFNLIILVIIAIVRLSIWGYRSGADELTPSAKTKLNTDVVLYNQLFTTTFLIISYFVLRKWPHVQYLISPGMQLCGVITRFLIHSFYSNMDKQVLIDSTIRFVIIINMFQAILFMPDYLKAFIWRCPLSVAVQFELVFALRK
jgi:hypothetical protein